jgi:hypothetical protein
MNQQKCNIKVNPSLKFLNIILNGFSSNVIPFGKRKHFDWANNVVQFIWTKVTPLTGKSFRQ